MTSASAAGNNAGAVSKVEYARQITDESLEELTQQLEAGESEQLTAYIEAMSRFHAYSFGNIMLILAQKPDATRIAGFHTWKSLGRSVRKGEKGIAIFAPMVLKSKRSADGEEAEDDDDRRPKRIAFRVVHVFDISQTDGDALPEPVRVGGDPGDALARLERAVESSGVTVEMSLQLGSADGVSTGGRILLNARLSAAERFSVLAHEWAHEMLHQGDVKRPEKTVRETEAEAVAFVVSRAVGLEVGSASADYIRLYRGDAELLAASLDRIQKTACRIIESIDSSRERAEDRVKSVVGRAASERRQR